MAVPADWSITFVYQNGGQFAGVGDPRAICPHCRQASTFSIRSQQHDRIGQRTAVYLLLQCNYATCRKNVYVQTSVRVALTKNEAADDFFMYPSLDIEPAHPGVPIAISEDWQEAQRAMQAGATKAGAVMLRRVLYSVLIDKGCKLHPLREGMEQLIGGQRLPAIFDEWLPAIRDDGHDGAHPDRALNVSVENLNETREYTAELLRFLYIEPYDFQLRKARNATATATS